MAKILLVKTFEGFANNKRVPGNMLEPPLGLMYIAASIMKEFPGEHSIKIVDARLKQLSMNSISHIIKSFDPDVIGMSSLSYENDYMHQVANTAKAVKKTSIIVVGGPHATLYHEEVLKNHNIDIAVIGEGELTMVDLLSCVKDSRNINDVKGIAYKKDGKIILNKRREFINDLDNVPFPAWDLIPIDDYCVAPILSMTGFSPQKKYMALFSSRGCPYKCIFCTRIFGDMFRARSAENVFNEIFDLYTKYEVREFHVLDDIFNFAPERVNTLCDFIIQSGIKIDLAFPSGLRADILDEEMIAKLKRSGVYYVSLAIETASPRLQKLLKKNMDTVNFLRIVDICDRYKIITGGFFMLGFPGETKAEIHQTINFACRAHLDFAMFYTVTPQNKTELLSQIKIRNPDYRINVCDNHYYITNKAYEKQIVNLPIARLRIKAGIKFYFNPRRLFKLWRKSRGKISLSKLVILAIRRIPSYLQSII
jgi:anaerobic magnesium-protoporphyrin IX monomethyl ester cyclase